MKPSLILLPVCLMAGGVLAGRFLWQPARESGGRVTGAIKGAQREGVPASGEQEKGLAERPADEELGKTWDFLQRLEKTRVEEFPAFWVELENGGKADQPAGMEFSTEETLLAERWAELNPQDACDFFAVGAGRTGMLRAVFAVWSLKDGDGALKGLSELSSPGLRQTAAGGIFSAAADDPASLLTWSRRLSFLDGQKLEQSTFDAAIPREALRRAFELDPAGCRELEKRMPDWYEERLDAFASLDEAVADLPSLFARIDGPDGVDKKGASDFFGQLLPLADGHPDRLLAITERLTAKLGHGWLKWSQAGDLPPVLAALAKVAPDRIHGILEDASSQESGTDMVRFEAAANLLATDPVLALNVAPSGAPWLSEFLSGRLLTPGEGRLPQEILDLVRGAPSSMMRDSLLAEGLAAMKKESPEAAAAWVKALPAGELQAVARMALEDSPLRPGNADLERAALSAAAGGMNAASMERVRQLAQIAARTDPEGAAAQILAWPAGAVREKGLEVSGREWATYSTPDALNWVKTLPQESRGSALGGVLETWAASEPGAAAEYAASLPAGAERDAPVSGFARGLAGIDPGASLQWAATVQDPGLRRAALEEIASGWLAKSPEAAREGIGEIPGLTAEERQRLTNPNTTP